MINGDKFAGYIFFGGGIILLIAESESLYARLGSLGALVLGSFLLSLTTSSTKEGK